MSSPEVPSPETPATDGAPTAPPAPKPTPAAQADPATGGLAQEDAPETGVGSLFVSNYPPYSAWSTEAVEDALEALDAPPREGADLGLYLHIPFCRKRCKFCYFRVFTDKNSDDIGRYTEALATEIERLAERPALAGRRPRFVYFGGGTPSYISVRHLEALVERVQAAFPWDQAEEITFECEPGTLTRSKVEAIRGIGVTRLSLGVEHFNPEILEINGRAHREEEIWRCLPWVQAADFAQVNIDLIAGLVGDTWESWKETVAKTVDLAPDSVTIYQMELPWNARFSKDVLAGTFEHPLADWDTKRAWQTWAFEELGRHGYELSSAYTMVKKTPGREDDSRFVYRNSVWRGCDLAGAGVASFSHVSGVHFQNEDRWESYLEAIEEGPAGNGDGGSERAGLGGLALARAFVTSPRERLIRELILQLKLGTLEVAPLAEKFGVDPLAEFAEPLARLEERGMLTVERDRERPRIVLSTAGLERVDTLLPEFYDPQYRGARYT